MNYKFIQVADKYIGILFSIFVYYLRFLFIKKKNKPDLLKIKTFQFIKLLGGGNIYIALPFFYNLKKIYPNSSLEIICSNNIYNFVESAKIFDKIYVINIKNILTTFLTTLKILFIRKNDNLIVNLEPYSNFANILSNILKHKFYLSSNFEDKNFYTKLADKSVFFKNTMPIYKIHQKIFNYIEVEKMEINELRNQYLANNNFKPPKSENYSVGIIPFCSRLSEERKLSLENWSKILKKESNKNPIFYIFGDKSEHSKAQKFKKHISNLTSLKNIILLTKDYKFSEKINILNNVNIIYSIDTGYNHIARILNKKIYSFWGASDPYLMLDENYTSDEKIFYTNLPCSPCVHRNKKLPCNGDNICMEVDEIIINQKIKKAKWLV